MDKEKDNASEEIRSRHDADSGNDSTNQMLQHEKLIDPGNEHRHDSDKEHAGTDRAKHDADAGGDGTGTFGSKPE